MLKRQTICSDKALGVLPELLDKVPVTVRYALRFQHDGDPAHSTLTYVITAIPSFPLDEVDQSFTQHVPRCIKYRFFSLVAPQSTHLRPVTSFTPFG
ncbi:hypothetical protein AVEN_245978-1 [Araneus ventricosus]|uniref:Uncharacterized protein n=1 Tax=Araneus ventricosus TaxID=182803 RepID=A0A4Y2CY96_ARAVE|nr:hypothetical protein AVEN_98349-1 [Araneus ventricosus]GBM09441.1 hypothetical protein AVEN_245978-1 [Araneus ventricosus]